MESRTLDNTVNSYVAALFVRCLSQYYNKMESEVALLLSAKGLVSAPDSHAPARKEFGTFRL